MANGNLYFGTGVVTLSGSAGVLTVAKVEDITVDVAQSTKAYYGDQKFPIDIASTEGKISGKIKNAFIDPAFIAAWSGGTTTEQTTSSSIAVVNSAQGSDAISFKLQFVSSYKGKTADFTLNSVLIPKLAWAFKVGNHTSQDLDFEAFADDTGKVYTLVLSK